MAAKNQEKDQPEHEKTELSDEEVDAVTDEVSELLKCRGFDLELVVFYSPRDEQLHAVGYDGAPARFFRDLGANGPLRGGLGGPKAPEDRSDGAARSPDPPLST